MLSHKLYLKIIAFTYEMIFLPHLYQHYLHIQLFLDVQVWPLAPDDFN